MSQSYNSEADVLVVGAGMGGLTAAIQAAAEGARAVVMEKYPDVSRCSTAFSGGAFGVHTKPFGPHTPEELVERFIETSEGTCDVPVVRAFAQRASGDLQWLLEDVKLPTMPVGSRRTPRALQGGRTIPPHLLQVAQERGVQVLFNTKATGLLADASGRVSGVQAMTPQGPAEISAGAVVLTTGGFESNGEMVLKYLGPEVHSSAFRHRAASLSHTGDGQLMAMAMGASFGNHPFLLHCRPEDRSFTTLGTRPKSQGPIREMPRISHWGIWVNRKGQRFIDESDESDPISTAIWRQPEGVAALVFDEGLRQRFPEEAQRYEEKVSGIFITAESVEELATKTGVIPPERLRATVQAVN
ncbi:MAG TPA: FAD-dependent oxidoreductase, partial [Dehalococcoidia bacterium]|nr:FAD-dependent oxidoreductase [Dehalococcoidia bacterium]